MTQGSEFLKHHQPPKVYREGLPPVPERMKYLRVDERGYPVPWFVAWINGKPDFRVIREGGIPTAYSKKICWLCGVPMGKNLAFVIGPMCAVNRVTSEPPSHLECAQFALQSCPFMLLPQAKRRMSNLPEDGIEPAGTHHPRNPGVMVLWITSSYRPFRAGDGFLFSVSPPVRVGDSDYSVEWWREGRHATRAEAYEGLRSGMPFLIDAAVKDGGIAVAELTKQYQAALFLLPKGEPVPGLDTPAQPPAQAGGGAIAVPGIAPSCPSGS